MKENIVGGVPFQLDLSLPLYEQVVEQIRSAIAKKTIPLGEKIPSVRELAQALQINPNTVMRAYQELDREGLIETRRGQGTFITSSQERVIMVRETLVQKLIIDFVERLDSLGYTWADAEQWIKQSKAGIETGSQTERRQS